MTTHVSSASPLDIPVMRRFSRGQWVVGSCHIGRVLRVHDDESLDITLFDRDGKCIGRESPALNGPKGFEPCCSPENWRAIKKPRFPLTRFDYIENLVEYA